MDYKKKHCEKRLPLKYYVVSENEVIFHLNSEFDFETLELDFGVPKSSI